MYAYLNLVRYVQYNIICIIYTLSQNYCLLTIMGWNKVLHLGDNAETFFLRIKYKYCDIRHHFKFPFTSQKHFFPFPTLSEVCKNSTHVLCEHLKIILFLKKILIWNPLHCIWRFFCFTKHHENIEDFFETTTRLAAVLLWILLSKTLNKFIFFV